MEKKLLRRQLEIEQLISEVARKFVMVDKVTDAINEALEKIGRFSNASRAYVFEFDQEKINMNNTYEWCDDGVPAEIEVLQDLPISLFPWWIKTLESGTVLNIKDVSALGDYAKAEREILEPQGIKSVLVLPLFIKGELSGFVGFDNTHDTGHWTEDDQNILRVASELFSNAFARLLSEKELEDTNTYLEETLETLTQTQSQLVRQEQMVAIGQLAAGVAHEINNPLAFMLTNQGALKKYIDQLMEVLDKGQALLEDTLNETHIEVIKKDVETFRRHLVEIDIEFMKEDLADLMEDVDIGIQRVSKIVKGLRYFSHVNSDGDLDAYNLLEGIENTLIIANSRLRGKIVVEKDLPETLPAYWCNGNEINQVLLNLIMNAADAFEGVEDRQPQISIGVTYDDEVITCKIEDNGCGMSEEVANQVFNPFFTTKSIGQGTGLGMSIAYDIMKKNKGEILLETSVGKGTIFTLILPYGVSRD